MLRDAPNIQALWGDLIVEELVRNGVEDFVVCPGSRSTPLVQAIARNPRAQATLWLDERGAAYHALGIGRCGWPAAVVTTSGTAVANLLPAAVEASLDGVPLLLVTADRPHELREVGANQSIRQVGIFSDHVRWACDLPAPDTRMPARALLSTVDHAVHAAVDGHGPVHLNCPFREPLAPTDEGWDATWLADIDGWVDGDEPLTEILSGDLIDTLHDEELAERIRGAKRGLLVCGSMDHAAGEAVAELAARLGWPLWADLLSDLRLGATVLDRCTHLDRILEAGALPRPDMVLQFGGRLTSKRMQTYLAAGGFETYALVDPQPTRVDPAHQVTHRYVSEIHTTCSIVDEYLDAYPRAEPAADVRALDDAIEAAIEAAIDDGRALSEPFVARWLSRTVDPEHHLFVSNSMPVRDMQAFAVSDGPDVAVKSNRGASGIDGIVATAAGVAQGGLAPTTLLIGDLALLHDVNALAMLKALEHPLTIVVLNNGGGSIFSFLRIAEHADVLDPLVNTPHAITFDGVCASFDVPHTHVADRASLEAAYDEAIRAGVPWVIEVDSSLAGNKAEHDRIEAAIRQTLEQA